MSDYFGSKSINKEAHNPSDVDGDRDSLHHTLGSGPNQAAPGNHNHDKTYVKHRSPSMIAQFGASQLVATGGWVNLTNWAAGTYLGDAGKISPIGSGQYKIIDAGWYEVKLQTYFAAGAGAVRACRIVLDGVQMTQGNTGNNAGAELTATALWEGPVNSNQVFSFGVYQDAGGPLSVYASGGLGLTYVSIRKISDV